MSMLPKRSPEKAIHRLSGDHARPLARAASPVSRTSAATRMPLPSSADQSQISGAPLLSEV